MRRSPTRNDPANVPARLLGIIFGRVCRALAGVAFLLATACAIDGEKTVQGPAKRVEIDQTQQMLRAYEGDGLVLESPVSTGRGNSTPNGTYRVLDKQRMHYSRRYDNAAMPYSVQIRGHYFIHGFKHVPKRPASHGCIRLPLSGENAAKTFYDWVELGTPVVITGCWRG